MFLQVVYGTTENSPVTFLGFPQDAEELKFNTVGCIMGHTEVHFSYFINTANHHNNTVAYLCDPLLKAKVVDPATGEAVPLGTTGELMIRGYCVMNGYWGDPEKTREAINEARWYRTG